MVINKDELITENQNELIEEEAANTEILELSNDNFDLDDNKDLNSSNEIENEKNTETAETNCLALTVRKDYNMSIVKNSIFTTLRVSWKVALSTLLLNILKLFF